jgi:hypothetical protein
VGVPKPNFVWKNHCNKIACSLKNQPHTCNFSDTSIRYNHFRYRKVFPPVEWKKGNIKQSTLILDYKEGGLKMVDLQSFITGLRLSWVKRLRTTEGNWQKLTQIILGPENTNFIFELDKK